MTVIQIIVRCTKDRDHAKVLRMNAGMGMGRAQVLAELLDGSSALYVHAPGEASVMGNCHVCRAKVVCEVSEREVKDA